MECLALLDSGNLALHLCKLLENRGMYFEVVPTPCKIAHTGCGYCIRCPCEQSRKLIAEAAAAGIRIREVYRVLPGAAKHKYEKIY